VYADASFATHLNGRSHSGIVITLGDSGGPIYVKSQVQTLVSTSLTEAELISMFSGSACATFTDHSERV
jgi:hypothetical protein